MIHREPGAKVYDIFTFFNELDLLEIRLNILDEFVDYFVIIESTETFSGLPKKLVYEENRERFSKFKHKIIHYVISDTPKDENDLRNRLHEKNIDLIERSAINAALTSDNVVKGVTHWLKEFYQKESIKKALRNLSENDICFVSDVDEIWNPKLEIDVRKNDIFKLRQEVYVYYLNNRSNEPWAGTLVTKYKNIKNSCLNHLRTASKTKYTYLNHGGWHFTNQGGAEQIREKLEASYSKDDYNTVGNQRQIQERLEKNQDYIGRKFSFVFDEKGLPPYIVNNKKVYKHLWKLPTVIVKLHGGLGNQIFEYALGRSIEESTFQTVKFDLSWFSKQSKRSFVLDRFFAHVIPATASEVRFYHRAEKKSGISGLLQNFFRSKNIRIIQERSLRFSPEMIKVAGPCYVNGYWQTEKYFIKIKDKIRSEIRVKTPPTGENARMLEEIITNNSVAVHVRRGDYVNNLHTNAFHGVPELSYYNNAASHIIEKVSRPIFYIFSDDLLWVKENLKFSAPTIHVSQNDADQAHEDLRLMAHCKHHIIANSTFSWWGAWLAEHDNQIVIAPREWFRNLQQDATDILPQRWLRM